MMNAVVTANTQNRPHVDASACTATARILLRCCRCCHHLCHDQPGKRLLTNFHLATYSWVLYFLAFDPQCENNHNFCPLEKLVLFDDSSSVVGPTVYFNGCGLRCRSFRGRSQWKIRPFSIFAETVPELTVPLSPATDPCPTNQPLILELSNDHGGKGRRLAVQGVAMAAVLLCDERLELSDYGIGMDAAAHDLPSTSIVVHIIGQVGGAFFFDTWSALVQHERSASHHRQRWWRHRKVQQTATETSYVCARHNRTRTKEQNS
jgi:hypothetical protein